MPQFTHHSLPKVETGTASLATEPPPTVEEGNKRASEKEETAMWCLLEQRGRGDRQRWGWKDLLRASMGGWDMETQLTVSTHIPETP